MKSTILYRLLLFSAISSLCGCGSDEFVDGSSPTGVVETFSITVSDCGGYASASGGAHTRATEDGYTTTFTAGDRIGVFAVKEGQIMLEVNNLCLTAQADAGGGLVWKDATTGNGLLRFTGATYYAYYPYQSTLTGDPVSDATDANTFFGNIISNWAPATNQGTYAAYTAQDLMIAQGSEANKVLSFAMEHCMALVVIDLPRTQYTFDNTNPSIPDYIIDAPGTHFNSFTPHRMSDGTYRYLVKPAGSTASLSGGYTNARAKEVEWTIDAPAITSGEYKVFTVDGAGVTPITHTLQVGDFYLNDGSLVGKDETLTPEQKAACIGIVYCTDIDRIGDEAKKALSAPPHGLVMALTNASDGCRWGNFSIDENSDGAAGEPFQDNTITLQKQYNNVDGYGETHWILNTYKSDGTTLKDAYTAFYHASRYGTADSGTSQYAAPANTTGWFIPSMGQWWDILSNLGGIDLTTYRESGNSYTSIPDATQKAVNNMNKYLGKISAATKFSTATYFWSSSEYSSSGACRVSFSSNGTLYLSRNLKNYSDYKVRCVFAF